MSELLLNISGYLPADPGQNLVLRTFELVREALRRKGIDGPALALHLEKNLPRCSGLGSSASSVAATLAVCQGIFGEPFTRAEVYALAGPGRERALSRTWRSGRGPNAEGR